MAGPLNLFVDARPPPSPVIPIFFMFLPPPMKSGNFFLFPFLFCSSLGPGNPDFVEHGHGFLLGSLLELFSWFFVRPSRVTAGPPVRQFRIFGLYMLSGAFRVVIVARCHFRGRAPCTSAFLLHSFRDYPPPTEIFQSRVI